MARAAAVEMTPYYQDDAVTIYHGDCSAILAELPQMDAVITDPPYGVDFDYGEGGHDDSEEGYIEWLWPIIEQAEARVRPGGFVVVYQAARNARRWAEWFPREWRPIALPKMFVQMRKGVVPLYATDYALIWRVPGGQSMTYQEWMPLGNRDWYISRTPNFGLGRKSIDHPCPRPIDALRYLVQLVVPPGGSVLDPFLGSGTTLRAAKDLGRIGIGIEINEKWCGVSAGRMPQEVLGLSA